MSLDDVQALADALRRGLAGAPELEADDDDDDAGETMPKPPAAVIVTSAPIYVWRMSVERDPRGLIESVLLAPIQRAEVPR